MCGIVGAWNQQDEQLVAEMTRAVTHRGPDGLSWLVRQDGSVGASRLAIVGDRDASAVFHDPQTGATVLLNGEIYNAPSLRTELEAAGYTFDTDLETELIAKLYARRGLDFPAVLQGMFAIVILDSDRLVLTRDRFGIKPLHYAGVDKRVVFGSEIRAILTHPDVTPKLHIPALEEIAVFGYIFSLQKTLLDGILQVEPGTVVTFSQDGRHIRRYWQLPAASYLDQGRHLDYQNAVIELRNVVIEALDSLLSHGDHEVGIYLSGGLDSTILTVVSKAILGYPVTTFTLADGSESADLLAGREVAKKLGTRHIERQVTIEEYFQKLGHFAAHYESLVAGGTFDIHGGMAFHLLSETVSEHVKVALSGEGADELFGGYYWVYTHPLGFADRIRKRLQSSTNGHGASRIVSELFPLPEDECVYRRNAFDALMGGGLANYHLQSVDRSAGAFGFEIRPAYLCDKLADLALRLPIEYKVPDKHTTKRILRDAFRPELEHLGLGWVLTRSKEGMPAAVSHLAPLVADRIEALVSDSCLSQHPLRTYLRSKTDIYLFNLFAEAFLPEGGYALQDCSPQ